jgi:hypothetical protein
MMKKRGQSLLEMLPFIIAAVLVLAFTIWGFSTNWSAFSSFFPAANTVTSIVSSCQTACATSDTYGFCSLQRTLKADDLPLDTLGKPQTQVINTCKFFSSFMNKNGNKTYGISDCPAITC